MRYKLLGRSGLRVSELCLGTMTFGEDWGWGAPKEECAKMLARFVEAGGNFIDTANLYTNGNSERIVGELIGERRQEFVVATKYSLCTRATDPNAGGNQRKNLMQSLEASLRRLKTDYIDLYWVHAWDALTPTEEVMRGLEDAVRAGKVLYIGVSDTPAWVVSRANMLAEMRGWAAFVALQIEYSLVERTPERDLVPMAQALDLAVTPWAVLGSGILTGKYERGKAATKGTRLGESPARAGLLNDRNHAIAAEVGKVAKELGTTASRVAIAWLMQQAGVVIPILGARRASQLEDTLGAAELKLPEEALKKLDAVSRVELGFPHDFLQKVTTVLYGKTRELIDG